MSEKLKLGVILDKKLRYGGGCVYYINFNIYISSPYLGFLNAEKRHGRLEVYERMNQKKEILQ